MSLSGSLTFALALGMVAVISSANAEPWPPSVVGVWDVYANQNHLTMTIRTEGSTGDCRPIGGQIQNVGSAEAEDIRGFYCPMSGRISFLRVTPSNGNVFQTWTGNLSDPGTRVLIGGTFVAFGANNGEYSFYATKG
jgi:hypothetical protein